MLARILGCFLLEWRAPEGCTCIVTNPPKLADEFIRHGLTLVEKVIVLLRLMASEVADRSDLIDRHLVRQWVGIERLGRAENQELRDAVRMVRLRG